MLRPATPLTVLLFCAFVLLLISSLSTPVVRGLPLARWQNYNFGVLGYCQDGGACSSPKVGYTTDNIFKDIPPPFNLPSSARHSLSSLLIVHPVAAFMTLIMLALAAAAHFHAPSHSPRYLLALLILTLPTLLITLLAFLVDILLFIPHLAWGGWICLAATILIVISGICLCAMRRTLVSRKARRKRIQENAEMSGENFYNRQREQEAKLAAAASASSESKAPLVKDIGREESIRSQVVYEQQPGRDFQSQQPTTESYVKDENRFYGSSYSGPTLNNPSTGVSSPSQYADSRTPHSVDSGYPPSNFSRGRGGPPMRGRGMPRPYGRGGPRNGGPHGQAPPGFSGRGGYGPNVRGGYPGRGGPMPPHGPGSSYPGGGVIMGRRPPPGYPPPQQGSSNTYHGQETARSFPAATSTEYDQPPVSGANHQLYEQYDSSNTRSEQHSSQQRAVDEDGLVRAESPPAMGSVGHATELAPPDSSAFPAVSNRQTDPTDPTNPIPGGQVVASQSDWNSKKRSPSDPTRATSAVSQGSSHYYEDVPNQFLQGGRPPRGEPNPSQAAGMAPPTHAVVSQRGEHNYATDETYEEMPARARSPTTSEQSAWTSVSQRPANPDWKPGHGGEFNNFGPARRPNQSQMRQDMLLTNNPDFSVPGMGPPRGNARARGGYRGQGPPPMAPSGLELGPDGRYPEPAVMNSREI